MLSPAAGVGEAARRTLQAGVGPSNCLILFVTRVNTYIITTIT